MIVAITGHRPQGGMMPLFKGVDPYKYDYTKMIYLLIKYTNENKPDRFNIGMAQGFDQLMCVVAFVCSVPYDAYVPFPGQEIKWAERGIFGQKDYKDAILRAEHVYVSGPAYDRKYYHMRDKLMVDKADATWALLNPDVKDGGTFATVNYSAKQKKPVTNLWEYLRDNL